MNNRIGCDSPDGDVLAMTDSVMGSWTYSYDNMSRLTSCTPGAGTDYSIVAYADGRNWSFANPSFSVTTSGAAMIPSTSANTSKDVANAITFLGSELSGQSGSFEVFIWPGPPAQGGPAAVISLPWGSGSTSSSLAASLAAAIGSCSSNGNTMSGTASGPTVYLTTCQAGASYTATIDFNSYSGGGYSTPAFTAVAVSPTTIGVTTAPIYDSGTVTLTVNGTEIAATTFESASTPASIVAGLVSNGAHNTLATLAASATNSSELQMTAIGGGNETNYTYSTSVTYNSAVFAGPSFDGSPSSGAFSGGTNVPLYNWAISSYAPDGDVLAMTDSVMGTWTYTYDNMNRLTSGTATKGVDDGLTLGWTYDRYGNRWAQNATGSGNASASQPQLTFTGNNNRINGWSYDNAGNLLNDQIHAYTYDAENRIATLNGEPQYIYDAEGRRVAKTSSSGAPTIAQTQRLRFCASSV